MNKKNFLKAILLSCLFVFIIKNEQSVFNEVRCSSESFSTKIELVVQPNTNQFLNFLEENFSSIQNIDNTSFYLELVKSNKFIRKLPANSFNFNYLKKPDICAIQQNISILQKKNSWHQSSDENHSDII